MTARPGAQRPEPRPPWARGSPRSTGTPPTPTWSTPARSAAADAGAGRRGPTDRRRGRADRLAARGRRRCTARGPQPRGLHPLLVRASRRLRPCGPRRWSRCTSPTLPRARSSGTLRRRAPSPTAPSPDSVLESYVLALRAVAGTRRRRRVTVQCRTATRRDGATGCVPQRCGSRWTSAARHRPGQCPLPDRLHRLERRRARPHRRSRRSPPTAATPSRPRQRPRDLDVLNVARPAPRRCSSGRRERDVRGRVRGSPRDRVEHAALAQRSQGRSRVERSATVVEELRRVKDAYELGALREACAVGDRAFAELIADDCASG